ncbi:MAG: sulfotransferase family 2 domain-containing protein [Rubrobacter sp.]|nr:sulfotransferase family 2 domain-containing protein [Rubrobacter sp.]
MRCAVSEEHRFVYVVTPKVACTSIKTALLPLFGRDPAEAGDRGHAHKILAREGAIVSGDRFLSGLESRYRGYFKFSFVRNPYDRLVSCYYSKINPKVVGIDQEPHDGAELRPGMSFREFAEAVCSIPDEKANVHFRSQHLAISRGAGDGLPVDFLGRF